MVFFLLHPAAVSPRADARVSRFGFGVSDFKLPGSKFYDEALV
jgi:hypothetical protein